MRQDPGNLINDINLSYLYAFVAKEDMAIVLLHPENIEEGIGALERGGADLISAQEIYEL